MIKVSGVFAVVAHVPEGVSLFRSTGISIVPPLSIVVPSVLYVIVGRHIFVMVMMFFMMTVNLSS